MNHYVTLALTNRKSSVHLHALYSARTALRMFTPRRDHLLVCLLYLRFLFKSSYAFRTQEWFNLARDDVVRLRRTPPLVSFFGWWLVGCNNIFS
jgi:hypothetical protein